MTEDLNLLVNLKITSVKRIIKEHDLLAKEIAIRETKTPLVVHHRFLKLNTPFKLINTMALLILEGKIQRHCVASYYNDVNNGKCAIFTDIFKEKRYTIEIIFSEDKYLLSQCRGRFNSNPPEAYLKYVRTQIKRINEKNYLQKIS